MSTRAKKRSDRQKDRARGGVWELNPAAEATVAPAAKNLVILKIETDTNNTTRYKASIGDYFVYGVTSGGEKSVKDVLARMSAARAELTDELKRVVTSAVNTAVAASESGALDIGVAMGTLRVTHPRATSKWWGVIRAMFKGFDGHKARSTHIVQRYVEFYTDKVDRDKLYRILYEVTQMAFNAYGRFTLKTPAP
jgi:hypothetical protein